MDPAPLYLASASPRRRELIQALGRPVVVCASAVDEAALEAAFAGAPEDLAEYLAREKARAAAQALLEQESAVQPGVLIAADTTVLLDGQVLGKPADARQACTMLRALRGRTHQVVTGVASCKFSGRGALAGDGQRMPEAQDSAGALYSLRVGTAVLMRGYTDEEIAAYVDTGDPLDKAGAYAVQHVHFHPVARIEGCYTSVVGLPLCATVALVAQVESEGSVSDDGRPADSLWHRGTCPWSPRCRAPLPRFATRDLGAFQR